MKLKISKNTSGAYKDTYQRYTGVYRIEAAEDPFEDKMRKEERKETLGLILFVGFIIIGIACFLVASWQAHLLDLVVKYGETRPDRLFLNMDQVMFLEIVGMVFVFGPIAVAMNT